MKPEVKKLIIANLPYLLFVYLFGKLGQAYRLAEGIDLSQKLLHYADGCAAAFESAAPSFNPFDLLIGVAGAAALRLMVYCKGKNAKKYRKGVEYGSARWGGPKDIAPYIDPNFDNNILLTQTERITMNNRPKDPKTARNKNVLVIGGSGSGKTRFFVKPNLMQCVSKDYPTSFVITDPKAAPETCTCTTKCAAGAVNTNCPVCKTNMTECTGPEPEPQEPEETEQPQEDEAKGSGMGGLVVFLVVALIGGGAALYFFKFKKPKADTKGGDELDEYDFGEDEDDEDEPTPEDEEPAQDKEE